MQSHPELLLGCSEGFRANCARSLALQDRSIPQRIKARIQDESIGFMSHAQLLTPNANGNAKLLLGIKWQNIGRDMYMKTTGKFKADFEAFNEDRPELYREGLEFEGSVSLWTQSLRAH